MEFARYQDALRERLSPLRYEHSLRVVETALEMGRKFGLNPERVKTAALLHDYAKDMPKEELLEIGRREGLISDPVEEKQPDLLHGPVGAFLCERDLGIQDEGILKAIRYHTTANVQMSMLEIVIYLSDLLEPGRSYKGIKKLRQLCEKDMWAGLLRTIDESIEYIIRSKMLLHPRTVEARNWLLEKNKEAFYGE
ncbi:MAG: bis(5'-nucleosyl)-tetraphosphatase (symmetrical) YqeK [Peptococcia bacterium]